MEPIESAVKSAKRLAYEGRSIAYNALQQVVALAGAAVATQIVNNTRGAAGVPGANLADADATIAVTDANGNWRILPAATLGAGRILTLSVAGAVLGDQITITRLDANAFTYTIKDGGGTTLIVLPVSKTGFALCEFTGAAWILRAGSPT